MLKQFTFSAKDGFSIWFDTKHKKEYYITQVSLCKTKFVKEQGNQYNSIKLVDGYTNEFKDKKEIYFASSDIVSPFEENYGMFLINFLNADFSKFENAYLTFFCFYGMNILEEFYNKLPKIRKFESEQDFKNTYENIFYTVKEQLKDFQSLIKLTVNHTYNLKKQSKYQSSSYLTKFIAYTINKNLFKYTTNINIYFNVNYAYKTNDITSTQITPLKVQEHINNKIINPSESNIYNSNYITNIIYLCLNEIATNQKVSIGICKNCGKYFISYYKSPEKYCQITYAENDEICKDIGIQIAYKKKQKENPCLAFYRKTYQKNLMYAKRSQDEYVKKAFNDWKLLAKEKVKDFNNGLINEEELTEWLKSN